MTLRLGRTKRGLMVAGIAAMLMVLAVPASATTMAETCHPPRYDTVHCACEAVGRIWIKVTGGEWSCADEG